MLRKLDAPLIASPYSDEMAAHATFYDSAKQLMYDPHVAGVFQFTADESGRYGDTGFGRACIVARNAVRAKLGISFVNIVMTAGIPTSACSTRVTRRICTRCVNSWIAGRQPRSVTQGERRPGVHADRAARRIRPHAGRAQSAQGGRDHLKDAMSIAMAGGGVKGGRAIGATSPIGDEITTQAGAAIAASSSKTSPAPSTRRSASIGRDDHQHAVGPRLRIRSAGRSGSLHIGG